MSDLSQALVDAAAEAMAVHDGYVWRGDLDDESVTHASASWFEARSKVAVAAVLETLAAELPPAWTGLPSQLRGLAAEVKEDTA